VKLFMNCLLFGIAVFAAMLVGVLYPPNSGRLIVMLESSEDPVAVYSILKNTDGWLVEKISNRTYIVESKSKNFPAKLYGNGALLVVNAAAQYGCETPQANDNRPRNTANPYRNTAKIY